MINYGKKLFAHGCMASSSTCSNLTFSRLCHQSRRLSAALQFSASTPNQVENDDLVPKFATIKTKRIVEFRKNLKKGPNIHYFTSNSKTLTELNVNRIDDNNNNDHPYLRNEFVNGKERKVFFDVYGCQMNVNDTEVAWSILKNAGFSRTNVKEEADVILVMTCSIREGAENKIWSNLQFLRHLKKKRAQKNSTPLKIGILGCMAERLKTKLLDKEKIVDLVAGPDSYKDLPAMLSVADGGYAAVNVMLSIDETYADIVPVRLDTSSPSAFVSIMRGCDNMCSYCIVPFTRGRERSRPMSSILEEVKSLSDQGIKEITLLGQNVNSYRDMSECVHAVSSNETNLADGFKTIYKTKKGGKRFVDLLESVAEIDPEMRIRFTSPHPKDFPDEVLGLIKDKHNICNQLHMPAQSGNDEVLRSMRRGYDRESYLNLVEKTKSIIPDVSLSSDFICGFCGETEDAHRDTISLIEAVKYRTAFIFPYSLREKTHAHRKLHDDVDLAVKKRRAAEAVDAFRKGADLINRSCIGQKQLILIEGKSKRSPNFLAGRNEGNVKVIVPNIELKDGDSLKQISPGNYLAVQILDGNSQVLKAVPLHHSSLKEYSNVNLL